MTRTLDTLGRIITRCDAWTPALVARFAADSAAYGTGDDHSDADAYLIETWETITACAIRAMLAR